MNHDDILDLSTSKSLSHFQTLQEKYQKLFNTFFWLSVLCLICILGIILKVPQRDLDNAPYLPLLLLLSFVGGTTMLCTALFKFLATHHKRNIATYRETTYPFANDIFMARVYFFLSTLIFAIVISFTGETLDKQTRNFERGEPREWAISLFITTLIAISAFFYAVGLRGVYQWALYLDHKIRTARNYDTRTNIILPRFLILLGWGLILIFDIFLNSFQIARICEEFARSFDRDIRNIITFSMIAVFFNYLIYGAFSLFLWIHTIISYKSQDAENT